MIIFTLLFAMCVCWGIQFDHDRYMEDYLSKSQTNAIKGIFIIVVFMNHISEYYNIAGADLTAWYDRIFFLIPRGFGQLMVVMFLFYSGYGVMESIKTKGVEYVDAIPKRRILTILLNFDVAVLVFAVVSLIIGISYSTYEIVLSFVGWESVGNSNWYIFVIIICYALTYVGQKLNSAKGALLACILIILFACLLSITKGTWWYNTMLAYCAGLMFSEHKEFLAHSMEKNYKCWISGIGMGFVSCLCVYLIFYGPFKGEMQRIGALVFDIMSVFFALLVVLITMKISIGNKVLEWLGMNLFPLYIYQRLSMMVLTELYPDTIVGQHPYVFLLLCLSITCGIAWCYKWINIKLA